MPASILCKTKGMILLADDVSRKRRPVGLPRKQWEKKPIDGDVDGRNELRSKTGTAENENENSEGQTAAGKMRRGGPVQLPGSAAFRVSGIISHYGSRRCVSRHN